MPELPEVEIMARNLHGWLVGRLLIDVEVVDDKFEGIDWSAVIGRCVLEVFRRGKYAVISFDSGSVVVIHYRMTGKTVLDPDRLRRARLRLKADGSVVVAFEDPRRFGTVQVMNAKDLDDFFVQKGLGPEPWPDARTGVWWSERLGLVRSSIKVALMRQDRVAGLGNIAASEVLFRSGIHPSQFAKQMSLPQWDRLAKAVHGFIDHTLAEESGDEIQYVNQGGEGSFAVYGHAGSPCPQCRTTIERMNQSGRSTFFCPTCQPLS